MDWTLPTQHYAQITAAQWARSTKKPDVSTKPLARPFARSLAPLTRSLAHFAHSLARRKVNFWCLKMTWFCPIVQRWFDEANGFSSFLFIEQSVWWWRLLIAKMLFTSHIFFGFIVFLRDPSQNLLNLRDLVSSLVHDERFFFPNFQSTYGKNSF